MDNSLKEKRKKVLNYGEEDGHMGVLGP